MYIRIPNKIPPANTPPSREPIFEFSPEGTETNKIPSPSRQAARGKSEENHGKFREFSEKLEVPQVHKGKFVKNYAEGDFLKNRDFENFENLEKSARGRVPKLTKSPPPLLAGRNPGFSAQEGILLQIQMY